MRSKTVELLKDKIEEAVAQVIMRTRPKRLPFRPSQRNMHLMVRAVVAESDPLEECPKATGEVDSFLVEVAD